MEQVTPNINKAYRISLSPPSHTNMNTISSLSNTSRVLM